jgi:hypothetical protein
MRKALYLFSGIVVLLACLIAIKAYNIIQTPVPEITENVASVDSLTSAIMLMKQSKASKKKKNCAKSASSGRKESRVSI